jgi:LysM repeat protein
MHRERERFMNTLNPFVPSISLIKVPSRDQRSWFRKVVFGVLAAQLVFILALLLNQGRSEVASPEVAAISVSVASDHAADPAPGAPPAAVNPNPDTSAPSAVIMPVPPAQSGATYVVKSGDTLCGIARSCGCTVKALKSVNSLGTERLMVGQQLKLPESRVQVASLTRPL